MSEERSFAEEFYPLDLGTGMRVRMMLSGDLITAHRNDRGEPCGGFVRLSGKAPAHELVSLEPLTISPNVTCQTCHASGFIREGRWLPL